MRFYKSNSVIFRDVDRSNVMEDYICHSGRKGMKWYQHIFTKDKNENKKSNNSSENKDGDRIIEKGKNFGRFSDNKGIRGGTYVFSNDTGYDRDDYKDAFDKGGLGADPYKGKAYEIKLKNIEPVRMRAAQKIAQDLINEYGEKFEKKRLNKLHKELSDLGYYDEDIHSYYQAKDKYVERHAGEKKKKKAETELENYEDRLFELSNKNLFKNGESMIKKYRDMGYDMIPDIEDYNMARSASIIINARKFKVDDVIDLSYQYR